MSRRRVLSWVGVIVVSLGALAVGTLDPGRGPTPTSRAEHIAAELRCPVCQGLSVLASDSPTARSIRQDVSRRINAGQSDAHIRQAYVDRYGEWILLRPRSRGIGVLVWTLPAAAALGGGLVLAVALARWRRRFARQATPEDRLVVERALGHRLGGGT